MVRICLCGSWRCLSMYRSWVDLGTSAPDFLVPSQPLHSVPQLFRVWLPRTKTCWCYDDSFSSRLVSAALLAWYFGHAIHRPRQHPYQGCRWGHAIRPCERCPLQCCRQRCLPFEMGHSRILCLLRCFSHSCSIDVQDRGWRLARLALLALKARSKLIQLL